MRQKSTQWKDAEQHIPLGIIVVCGTSRLCLAGFHSDTPAGVKLYAPGVRVKRRPRHGIFKVHCPDHNEHPLDLARVALQIELLHPDERRNWPRVDAQKVV